MTRQVAVIGGGLAGIAAALRCADAGDAVCLYEAHRGLGGLTRSFRRGELWVDTGQHVFLRCCTAYRQLLRRLAVADAVTLQPRLDIPVRVPGRPKAARLGRTGLPAPLHLAAHLARYGPLSPLERLGCVRAMAALRRLDPGSPALDRRSFGDWLGAHGQGEHAITALWDLIGVATLNAHADEASLALAAMVFQHGLLSSPDAGDIGWTTQPLGQVHGQAALRALRQAGVQLRLASPVRAVTAAVSGWRVHTDHRRYQEEKRESDAVVLAAPATTAERLLPADALSLRPGWSTRLGTTAIINAHLVLDRRVMAEPLLAGVGTDIQWVFDRTGASGLERGQYLAVSLSAADHLVRVPTAALRARLWPALCELLPGMERARLRDFFITREPKATFRQAPGSRANRPPTRTRHPGLVLAGAYTDTGWPATMEGAVRSGNAAAAAVAEPVPLSDVREGARA